MLLLLLFGLLCLEDVFADLVRTACRRLGWKRPSDIQREALPHALKGRDVIGLAKTGSGKTGAFAIPILQSLLSNPQTLCACVLAPTRCARGQTSSLPCIGVICFPSAFLLCCCCCCVCPLLFIPLFSSRNTSELAFQIAENFEALAPPGFRCATVVGGVDMMTQSIALSKKPHVVVATPGRLVDHLENTKGFSLKTLRFFVLDEADRLLNMDFEEEINKILKLIPRERQTFLFSATMTTKVAKLQRASLHNPVKVEVASKCDLVEKSRNDWIFGSGTHRISRNDAIFCSGTR